MSSGKRKRAAQEIAGSPTKRIAIAPSPSDTIQVSVLTEPKEWMPVVAQTPGLSIPTISFKPYTSSSSSPHISSSLLLHSSDHPKLDYSAQETPSPHLKHYLAIFDPAASTLQLVPTKTLTVRATPRAPSTAAASNPSQSRSAARNALGLAFGTKKSQKAIRSLTENALSPSKKFTKSSQALADAVVDAIPADKTLSREAMQAEADNAKPRPKANLQAETPAEVYSIEELVGGKEVMRMVGVKDWVDTVESESEILVKSRFVAQRVEAVVRSGNVRKMKGLRYLLLLIEWYLALKPARGSSGGGAASGKNPSRSIPKEPELSEKLPGWSQSLLATLSARFSPSHAPPGILNAASITLLLTTIFALTLCIDDQTTDTIDIREDLRLEPRQVNAQFSELGARTGPLTETERTRMGVGKAEAKMHVIAKLRLPLQWPKLRIAASARGGRR